MKKTIAVIIILALCLCMGVAHAEVREFLKPEFKQERAERKARLNQAQKDFMGWMTDPSRNKKYGYDFSNP